MLAAGRGKAGVQVGSGTEVQPARKVSGTTIPSNAERARVDERPRWVLVSREIMVAILFWVLTMGQAYWEKRGEMGRNFADADITCLAGFHGKTSLSIDNWAC